MLVNVIVPDEYMGDVMGDLNSRRGMIQGMEARQPVLSRSQHMCRFLRCLDMRQSCVQERRDADSILWSLVIIRASSEEHSGKDY